MGGDMPPWVGLPPLPTGIGAPQPLGSLTQAVLIHLLSCHIPVSLIILMRIMIHTWAIQTR